MDDLPREQVLETIDRAVDDLLRSAGIEAPPVDAIVLAQRHLGMVVCVDKQQHQRGRAQRAAGQKQIFLRPEPTEERHQWTVAHEIGEHMKSGLLERLGIAPEETRAMAGESLANLFAYHLLVPQCWFRTDAPELGHDVLELKARYRTASHEVVAWRLLDQPAPCIITIIDNDKVSRRRSNAWPVTRKLQPVELACQQYVSRHGRAHQMTENAWTVHGWPVHQTEWKREILRSVVEESG